MRHRFDSCSKLLWIHLPVLCHFRACGLISSWMHATRGIQPCIWWTQNHSGLIHRQWLLPTWNNGMVYKCTALKLWYDCLGSLATVAMQDGSLIGSHWGPGCSTISSCYIKTSASCCKYADRCLNMHDLCVSFPVYIPGQDRNDTGIEVLSCPNINLSIKASVHILWHF